MERERKSRVVFGEMKFVVQKSDTRGSRSLKETTVAYLENWMDICKKAGDKAIVGHGIEYTWLGNKKHKDNGCCRCQGGKFRQ